MSVWNARNMSNEWNDVNYIDELKRTRNFVLTHDKGKLGTRGHNNNDGTTLCWMNDNRGRKLRDK